MKSPVLLALPIAIGIALSTPLLSTEIPDINCREMVLNYDSNLTPAELARLDLLQGLWVREDPVSGSDITFQFNESGSVDIIFNRINGSVNYARAHWHVEESDGHALLVWKEYREKDRLLKIDQNCEGIVLTNMLTDHEYFLTYVPKAGKNRIEFIKKSMRGTWTNGTYPFAIAEKEEDCGTFEPIKGAFLKYSFNQDGIYVKQWGSHRVEFTETGTWEISKDGNYILFRADSKSSAQEDAKTDIARIKLIDLDRLVLKQSLRSPEFEALFCTGRKYIMFVK